MTVEANAASPSAYTISALRLPTEWVFYNSNTISFDGRAGGYIRISNSSAPYDVGVTWQSDGGFSVQPFDGQYEQAIVNGFAGNGDSFGVIRLPNGQFPSPILWRNGGSAPGIVLPTFGRGGLVSTSSPGFLFGETGDPTQADYVHRMTTWDADGNNPQLVTGLGPGVSRVTSANDAGIFVGSLRIADFSQPGQAVIGRNGAAELMSYPGFNTIRAGDINNSDWVVGYWQGLTGGTRSFIAKAFGT